MKLTIHDSPEGDTYFNIAVNESPPYVASVFGDTPEEAHKLASLFVAAPDLLTALHGMLEVFVDSDQLSGCEGMKTVKFARKIIAKAEGKTK